MSKTTTKRRIHSTSSNTSDSGSSVSSVSSNYDNGIRHDNNVNSDYDVSRINYNSSSSSVNNNSIGGNDTSIMKTTVKKKERMQYKQLEFQENVKLCMEYFWRGVCDAFTWPTSLITIYGSSTLRNRTLKCLILNGVIFIGRNPISNSKGEEHYSPFITNILDSIVNLIYQILESSSG
ncbi:6020_t:CDS:2 [Entrophospora sp. SA101]|nr:6020_t:CDS:2 [Entrophospora sp. SA101]